MSSEPQISIVLPLYNALAYLECGLATINAQSFKNWELVAVNDGSTDNTRERFLEITRDWKQSVKLIDRQNGGGFAARNTGLDHATAKYIAFFDVDDRWYPQHLQELFDILESHSEVDWVYAANKIIDLTEGEKLVAESNFLNQGYPKEFLALNAIRHGDLSIINDPRAAEYQFRYGLHLGQQFSLLRREVFEGYRFRSDYRNEGADQVSVIRALKSGFKLAYLNHIHGEYAIHANNASAGCKGAPLEKYIRLRKALIRGFQELGSEVELSISELKALHWKLGQDYFWQLGYNLSWQNGFYAEAFGYFKKGLFYSPFDWRMLKTYILCSIRSRFLK